ncbi:MAG: ABC transporter permease [Planctomycetota bacterium]|nr:ABC transporter permease [Planctomycetota bacterium]
MYSFIQDIRFAFRVMVKNYGLTSIAVLTLALGIGANTAIFSLVDALLIKPLPFPDPDRLVFLWNKNPNLSFNQIGLTNEDFLDYQKQSSSFEAMALYEYDSATLTGSGTPQEINLIRAQPEMLSLHNLPAELGRFYTNDELEGMDDVIVLSHSFWQSRYGGDVNIVGQEISLKHETRTIIGVLPKAFTINWNRVDAWVPLVLGPDDLNRENHNCRAVARLLPGVSLDAAQVELSNIASRLGQEYPDTNASWDVVLESYRDDVIDKDGQLAFLFLSFAVAFVLLIACTNVANLLLARSSARQREFAVRIALGAGRWRMMRQLISESLVLAVLGGIGGLLFAMWGMDAMVASLPERIPLKDEINLNPRTLSFTAMASLVSALLFGLTPAIRSAKVSLVESLKDGTSSTSASKARRRGRDALVVGQIAMAMALVLCTGLMVKSFLNIMKFDPGYNMSQILTMQVKLSDSDYQSDEQKNQFTNQLVERVRSLPGVIVATASYDIPLGSFPQSTLHVQGFENPDENAELWTPFNYIGTDYFKTLRTSILEGREFTDQDEADSPGVAMVNTFLADRFWPGESALGKLIRLDDGEDDPWIMVVGVVENTIMDFMDPNAEFEVYLPTTQAPRSRMNFMARTEGDPHALVASMQGAVWAIDPNLPISVVQTIDDRFEENFSTYGTFVGMMFALASIALVLSCVGLYGVMAFTVQMRTQELGIRLALGATTRDVLSLILRRGIGITMIGVIIGAVMATVLARLLESIMLDVTPTDPVIFLGVGGMLVFVALLACYLPARRATKIDPLKSLRYE